MTILALESSAGPVSVAILTDGKIVAAQFENSGLTHSSTLLPMVDSVLNASGLDLSDISAIAVAAGPGSFTGLRIGVSTAKGLAWGRSIPCLAVSTLEAMARQASGVEGILVPVMDARRGQFYNALFRSNGKDIQRLTPDRAIAAEDLALELEKYHGNKIVFLGDGMEKCLDILGGEAGERSLEDVRWQSAVGVAIGANIKASRGEFVTASQLKPNYIRLSQAERERLEKESRF